MKEKIKNASKPMLIIYILLLLGIIISFAFFTKNILSLEGIETTLRYIALGILALWIFLYLLFGFRASYKRKKISFTFLSLITAILIPIFTIGSYYIDKIYNKLENFTLKEISTYSSVLLTMKETELNSESKLGRISNENDREGYILAKEMIEKENIKNEIIPYDDFLIMLNDLYNGEIDGVFVSGNYKILFGNEEKFQNIGSDTKVVHTYSKEMKNEESLLTNTKKLTEPFTILILGVDSEEQNGMNPNAAFNGDTLMLITFNPNTLTSTMFSIPRDMYVPISCNNNRYNKINSAAAYGTTCVINTIKQMTDIDIDYFVKVNFKGVVDLVDALGGIDVDVEPPAPSLNAYKGKICEQDSQRRFGEHLICIDPGENVHLNGEQTLAYARCRHLYLQSDIARNQHQQAIIESLAKKIMKVSSFSDFENLLNTISNNIATNMQTSQILSFYQTIKNMILNGLKGEEFLTIQKTHLEYYNLNIWLPSASMLTSALGYYPGSLNAISKAMKENLEILKTENIKTFEYDYNEDLEYSSEIIGQGIRTGATLQLMPDLSGQTVMYAENWASKNGITLTKEFVESESVPGIIINQSVHAGEFLKNISKVTIYISKAKTTTTKPKEDLDEKNEKKSDEKNNTTEPNVPGSPTEKDKDKTTKDEKADTSLKTPGLEETEEE